MATFSFAGLENLKVQGPGHCIYCGAEDVKLTDEHIIPYFAGGTAQLVGASCLSCNKITSRIDGYCAYRIMYGFRHFHGIQSRTRSKLNTIPIRFETATGSVIRQVRFDDAPQLMYLPEYDLPGILVNGPRNGVVTPQSMVLWTTQDVQERADRMKQPGDTSWSIDAGGNWELFLRFVAKTALAGAVALARYDSRKSPLGNVVLGRDKGLRYFVGGDGSRTGIRTEYRMPPLTSETASIGFQKWGSPVADHPEVLGVQVTFFAQSKMPNYYAVVGPAPPEDIEDLVRDPNAP